MNPLHVLVAGTVAILMLVRPALAENTGAALVEGSWRIVQGTPAPWATGDELAAIDIQGLAGRTVRFAGTRITGGGALACGEVAYEQVDVPAQGLFQGGLPEPADTFAARLGLVRLPAPSLRVNCDRGTYDYHFVDEATLLVALDNVIWTLAFHPAGARAAAEGFLKAHFSGDMAFTPESVARKGRWLSAGLRQAMRRYFELPQPSDEVPVINGDPFTDTQEYPAGFSIARVRMARDRARVEVAYRGAKRRVTFLLVRSKAEGWRIDDAVSGTSTLRGLLAAAGRP